MLGSDWLGTRDPAGEFSLYGSIGKQEWFCQESNNLKGLLSSRCIARESLIWVI